MCDEIAIICNVYLLDITIIPQSALVATSGKLEK